MKIALKIIVPLVILVLAVFGFRGLAKLKPEPKSKEPAPVIPVVETIRVRAEDHAPPVLTFGTVSSYFETTLTAQLTGRVTFVSPSFREGEMVEEDHLLVKIDDTDFQAALAGEEANLTVAQRTLAEEEIRAEQAAGDWEASGRNLSTASDFVLRKPQLAAAEADIEAVRARIMKAQADVERAEVRAPFSAIVTAREASPGNLATPQTVLGSLISTEKVEIRLPLNPEQAARVSIPAKATITSPLKPEVSWEAELKRMEPVVDQQNQVMYAVAEVQKPFGEGKEPLSVGIFANARVEASAIENSYKIPEAAHVEDEFVWIMDEGGELKRVEARRVFMQDGFVFVKVEEMGGAELDVIARPLSNFRTGMKVKERDE